MKSSKSMSRRLEAGTLFEQETLCRRTKVSFLHPKVRSSMEEYLGDKIVETETGK